ncbi:hypothetical protein CBR_g22207 [Chara braunii]|uniref:Uncharacterized protein n=1 Tax=Chara braunii TaxID=69332 RepID=A0A388L2D2_CHABU|nr:hypothetical protein CBR_g22207 [Chara braunii]|eukprot:GBG76459.1 hypothetical protein CBR_g22207 [Chara braunii]
MATSSMTQPSTQPTSSGVSQSGAQAVTSQIGHVRVSQSPITPEDLEIRQAEELQDEVQRQMDGVVERRRKAMQRKARLESRLQELGRLERLDEATLDPAIRVLRGALLSVAEAQSVQQELLADLVAGQKQILAELRGIRPTARPPQFAVVPPVGAGPSSMPQRTGQTFSPMFGMPSPGGLGATSGPVHSVSAVPSTTVVTTVPLSSQAQVRLQQPVSVAMQPLHQAPGPMQQMQWMPKIPLMSPKPFSGDKKREEDLDTWVRTVPTYVRHKLTRPEQEVVVAASFLEGSAARWLNGLVQQQGYSQDFDAWAQSQTLEQFVRFVYNRWNDPQGAQKATDVINYLCSRRFKDVRELTNTVERLLVVPGVRFDPQVLLTDYRVRSHSVVPPRSKYQQQRLSRRTTAAASSTTTAVPVTTGVLPACPVQGASEPLSAYLQRVQAFTDVVATAKTQQEAAEAERQRLASEAATQTQRTTEADAVARDKRNAISMEALTQNESHWTTLLQDMLFVPSDTQADPTPAEEERSNLADLMLNVMRATQRKDAAALTAAVRAAATHQQQQQQLLSTTTARVNSIEAKASAVPGCTTYMAKQLNERIDHAVSLIGELSDFTSPTTISSTVVAIKTDITKLKSQPATTAKVYKMPRFNIDKFEDYNKTDALTWWQAFLTEASCHKVPAEDMLKALYLQLIGGAQTWMNNLAVNKGTTIAELYKHLTWEDFEQMWFTRFMVRNVVKAAMNEVYTCSQGNMPTRDWTIKWQKIVTTPGFDLSFTNQRSEFFSRSCAGLRTALDNEYDYASFQAILDRANLVIQMDDKAANEKQSQPHYVAKQGYQRQTHNNVVISEESVDLHVAAASSSDGGTVAALPPKHPKRV